MYDLTKTRVEFTVTVDGIEHQIVHVFRPNTCSEELAHLKAEAEENKLPDLEMYAARTERKRAWWDSHIIEVAGYQFPASLVGDGWKEFVPSAHKYNGYWFFFSKKESYERPGQTSATNSSETAPAIVPDGTSVPSSKAPPDKTCATSQGLDVPTPAPSIPAGSDTSSESRT